MSIVKGGHGRKKKLLKAYKLKQKERNFVTTYYHMVSRKVINFAMENHAKYIHLEDLSGFTNKRDVEITRNWSYYQFQEYICNKAEVYGIKIRKVNPRNTSQKCSFCGHLDYGQRINPKTFKCKQYGREFNADYNAALYIALSTEYV